MRRMNQFMHLSSLTFKKLDIFLYQGVPPPQASQGGSWRFGTTSTRFPRKIYNRRMGQFTYSNSLTLKNWIYFNFMGVQPPYSSQGGSWRFGTTSIRFPRKIYLRGMGQFIHLNSVTQRNWLYLNIQGGSAPISPIRGVVRTLGLLPLVSPENCTLSKWVGFYM